MSAILCPGFCPIWPCEYVYLNLSSIEYVIDGDPTIYPFPFSGWVLLRHNFVPDEDPELNIPNCGRHWGGYFRVDGDPMFGQEGFRDIYIFVCCVNKDLSYPVVHFNFQDHIREIGQPDPNIYICIRDICLDIIVCRCTDRPEPGLPGFNYGVASSPTFSAESTCSDITINNFNSLTSMEVRCFCNDACDCTGIPEGIPVLLQCDDGSGYEDIGSGSLVYFDQTDDIPFPHWEGEVAFTVGADSCSVRVFLLCGTFTGESYNFTVGPPEDIPPPGCIALVLDLIAATGTATETGGSCDPFCFEVDMGGTWIGCFTGGGGAGARWVVGTCDP